MMSPDLDPIVVPPPSDEDTSSEVRVDPRFAFYDEDSPIDLKIICADPERPMRLPTLTLAEYSSLVLGIESREWIRYQTANGYDRLDGQPFLYKTRSPGQGRSVPNRMGERRLTVADMERLTYAFFVNARISGEQYQNAFEALRGLARVQGVLPRRGKLSPGAVAKISRATKSHPCPECKQAFPTDKGLKVHVGQAHRETGLTHQSHERRAAKAAAKAPSRRLGNIPKGGGAPAVDIVFREAPTP